MNQDGEIEGFTHILRNTLHEIQHMILGCLVLEEKPLVAPVQGGAYSFLISLLVVNQSSSMEQESPDSRGISQCPWENLYIPPSVLSLAGTNLRIQERQKQQSRS